MKAYRLPDGAMALFRPDANAHRFNASADRLAMPHLPEDLFIEAVRRLVMADSEWFPPVEGGSLYLRPFMFATEAFLGVRPARSEEHTSELQSLMRISYAVFCLKKKKKNKTQIEHSDI